MWSAGLEQALAAGPTGYFTTLGKMHFMHIGSNQYQQVCIYWTAMLWMKISIDDRPLIRSRLEMAFWGAIFRNQIVKCKSMLTSVPIFSVIPILMPDLEIWNNFVKYAAASTSSMWLWWESWNAVKRWLLLELKSRCYCLWHNNTQSTSECPFHSMHHYPFVNTQYYWWKSWRDMSYPLQTTDNVAWVLLNA